MESPSSTRIVTRSQSRIASNSVSKNGDEASRTKSALIDITNDSPIVGLAGRSSIFEMKTPSSTVSKQSSNLPKSTPGSGEALLRGQVKTLLQKVEEEAEISKFLGPNNHGHGPHFPRLRGFNNSPMAILAPTPTNTPLVFGSGEELALDFLTESPIEDQLNLSQVGSEKVLITRSLFSDFSEKSDLSTVDSSDCKSAVTGQSKEEEDEEDASVWSMQVNASTIGEDDEDIETEGENKDEEDIYEEDEDYGEDEDGSVSELCEGMKRMKVEFEGKHTRFLYNSDDEIEKEEDVVRLKGLEQRFAEEEEED